MSNPNVDLTEVIEDAVNDSAITPEPVEDTTPEPTESLAEDTSGSEDTAEEPAENIADDTSGDEPEPKDEFERVVGMPQTGITGRENRIPYSRVKKITEKAVNEIAEAALGRKLAPGEKAPEVVKAYVAQIPELTAKVTDYEARLTQVGQVEQIMENEPKKFLQMLERVPAYQPFFKFVREAYALRQQGGQQPTAEEIAEAPDDMPEPNEELPDGSRVYNMEGLKALMAWHGKQTESRVNQQWEQRYAQLESRYRPIESEWRQRRHIESVLPQIREQIAEAKTWPMFDENEAEITKVLESDPKISLEGAYRKVVFPKLVAERTNMRQQFMQEAKQAPRATATPGRPTTARQVAPAGPRKLEDIIAEQVKSLKG